MDSEIKSLMDAADWWELVGYAAAALVLVGVVIESVELYRAIRSGKLREHIWETVGLSLLVFGLALEIMAQVQSNRRNGLIISLLDKQTEELRESNLKLEALIAPRTLVGAPAQAVIDAMKPFAGQRVAVWAYASDAEGQHFALRLWALLSNHLRVQKFIQFQVPTGVLTTGVEISGPKQAADALASVLNAQHIWAYVTEKAPIIPDGLQVFVGLKPASPQ